MDGGDADVAASGEHHAVKLGVAGLAAIVQLLAQPRGQFDIGVARIDRAVHAALQRQREIELGEIGRHRRGHVRILQFCRDIRPVVRGGAMHLAERGGEGRLQLKLVKPLAPVRPEFGGHAPGDETGAHRRRLALQPGQRFGVIIRQNLRDCREELRRFHQRTLETAERRREVLRSCLSSAEQASRQHAGREPPGLRAHGGITGGAGAETVDFVVGHGSPSRASSGSFSPLAGRRRGLRGAKGRLWTPVADRLWALASMSSGQYWGLPDGAEANAPAPHPLPAGGEKGQCLHRPYAPVNVALPSALALTMNPVSDAVAVGGRSSLATFSA